MPSKRAEHELVPERWDRLKALVNEALQRPAAERSAFLDGACAGDDSLRAEAESLLLFASGAASEVTTTRQTQTYPTDASPGASAGPATAGRFAVGSVLAGRYRIVERLGAGGMGEVYRAEDLTLDQTVALKFLPEELARDPVALKRLRGEVRIARQVSHPNVCRVYDIGQTDGMHFLSMEYIRGEDLKSLLRRVGRLAPEKTLEVAIQLTAGLGAAHDLGVLHRDLKPANIMFDERGQARIADFGLAIAAGSVETFDIPAGTPAYMAPEQRAGEEVTERSDVYSLGLVLYEAFTGSHALRTRASGSGSGSDVTPPSALVPGLDPTLERLILRCLARNPSDRPASAIALRAELPGGDALGAAVDRGETPAPGLVAGAGAFTALSRPVAWSGMAALLLALGASVWLGGRSDLTSMVPLPRSPELLSADAREMLANLGYGSENHDSTYGFARETGFLDHLVETGEVPSWREVLGRGEPSVIRFWYRESPRYLVPYRSTNFAPTAHDPPLVVPGMVSVELDPRGRLRRLSAIPPEEAAAPAGEEPPVWTRLLAAGGLDPAALRSAPPPEQISSPADARAAWTGVYPDAPEVPIRVEAASLGGRPTHFRVLEPWSSPTIDEGWMRTEDVAGDRVARLLHVGAHLGLLLGLGLVAQRNLRSRRGDQKRALRLCWIFFSLVMLQWIFSAHHVPAAAQLQVFFGGLYRAFFAAGLVWLFYLALEPYLRRLWPRTLISWVRLLDGRVRDPLVGRDVLLGCVVGAVFGFLIRLAQVSPVLRPGLPLRPDRPVHPAQLAALRGLGDAVAELFAVVVNNATHTLYLVIGLLMLRFLLRRTWLAVLVHGVLYVAVYASSFGLVMIVLYILCWYALLFRFGWVVVALMSIVANQLSGFPLTADASSWHAYATLLPLLFVLGLAGYAFKVSLGGKPLLADPLEGDGSRIMG